MCDSVLGVGSMVSTIVSEPALCYDWVVPDFVSLTGHVHSKGPVFVVQSKKFTVVCNPISYNFYIWIECLSDPPTVLTRVSLNLVIKDGSEKLICSGTNFNIGDENLVGKLTEADLTPNFLYNGLLRVRCRIEVQGEPEAKVAPLQGRTLIENLRKEFADQSTLTFTDCVLVIIICRG
jgi:hypothetical protein